MTGNSVMVLAPYKYEGTWVFDDPATGLVREPFVSGVPEILERALREANVPPGQAENGFRLTFSATPFPGHQIAAEWDGEEYGGNWYNTDRGERGWLCPAMFKYFPKAPERLYARVEAK